MSERAADNEDGQLPTETNAEDSSPVLAAEIVESQDRPAECTIFPPNVSEFELLSTWITAKEGSFVSLRDMR
ncbi:transcriptional regulator [Halogeometricum borinquense]|uniref:Transcriptional regulator n=1 Tax=Halogeometricum borinquense TaxID=60847 RepID=A0A6C0UKK6_9EURY|nr:transcriptional regulator [Halogeometricum borinquense]QIB76005.1 transcriptional regulator [Halogeometricum borinquense]